MVSWHQGFWTLRTGVRPLMAWWQGTRACGRGCKERACPRARASTICPALFRHGTPARLLVRIEHPNRILIGRIFAARVRHHSARKLPCLLVPPFVSRAAASPCCSSSLRRAPKAATPTRAPTPLPRGRPRVRPRPAPPVRPAEAPSRLLRHRVRGQHPHALTWPWPPTATSTSPSKAQPPHRQGAPKPAKVALVSFVAQRHHPTVEPIWSRIGSIGNTGVALANGFLYVDEGKQTSATPVATPRSFPRGSARS